MPFSVDSLRRLQICAQQASNRLSALLMQSDRVGGASSEARFSRTINEKALKGNKAQENMPLSPRELLEKELEAVVRDIDAIEYQIASDPPDTTGELLRLREIQRTYRGIAASIKQAIALEDPHSIA
jgi:hypothetical protein